MSLKIKKPRKIITFLGAGASATFGYPTTRVFLERLKENVSGELREYLNSLGNLHLVKDIEHVVEILDSLLTLKDYLSKHPLSGFFQKYQPLIDFGKKDEKHASKPALEYNVQWKKLVELTEALRNKIEEFTFEQFESDVNLFPNIKHVFEGYFSMLREHSQDKKVFEIFTTNYDNVIEDYCSQSGYVCSLSALERELQPKEKVILDQRYVLTKLHGSLNWLVNKQTKQVQVIEAQTRIRKESRSWDANEYVLFGTKTRLNESRIYDKLFDGFRNSLLQAEICVVIGFSFRDEHVCNIFRQALKENESLRVFVVSGSAKKSASYLIRKRSELDALIKKKRIILIKSKFGRSKTIDQIKENLFSI